MPRPSKPFPAYRRHKQSGQAIVTLPLPGGRRKDVLLGPYGSPQSREEYARLIRTWEAAGRNLPPASGPCPDITVSEALVRYVHHIEAYYRDPQGNPTGTAEDIKPTLGYLRRLYGPTLLAEFGPPHLKAIRESMIADGRVRTQVNKRVSQLRQFFKWCVEEQLVPPAVLEGLRAVRPLAPGRSGVKEGEPVEPADPTAVEKALPYMPPAVRAVVQILRLTGARPSEVLAARPADIDRTGPVWVLRPSRHKGSWRGKPRAVYLGPDAQAVLLPWLSGIGPDDFVFTPARSQSIRAAEPGRYTHRTLEQAVRRACTRAQVKPFSPYQVRHLRASEVREQYGLEHVRAVLGHSFKAMSDHYSRAADAPLAAAVAAEIG